MIIFILDADVPAVSEVVHQRFFDAASAEIEATLYRASSGQAWRKLKQGRWQAADGTILTIWQTGE